MNISPILNFLKEIFSPAVKREFRGVKIAFSSATPNQESRDSLQLAITYLLDDDQVKALGGKKPAEALVLVVISGYETFAVNILGEALLFEDDYQKVDDLWLGHVNFKLSDYKSLDPSAEYYVTVALGTFLSNTLHLGEA
jgi:hypothetical protein